MIDRRILIGWAAWLFAAGASAASLTIGVLQRADDQRRDP